MSAHPPVILELYWFPLDGFAPAMMEYIQAFPKHSRHTVLTWNTALGFPACMKDLPVDGVLLHYSLFGGPIYWLDDDWQEWLDAGDRPLAVIFQDEYRFWGMRHAFIERFDPDVIFTCYQEEAHARTYRSKGWEGQLVSSLTGYVGDDLRQLADKYANPEERSVDIGYRARQLDVSLGRGGAEKDRILEEFLKQPQVADLTLDVSNREEDRIYGEDWYRFMGDCKGVLGVEAGSSVVDFDDRIWAAERRHKTLHPDSSWEETAAAIDLDAHEGNLQLRTLSPRHFEAAAMGTCQILFRGSYSGVMEPDVHYICLEKDFSNFDDVFRRFMDNDARNAIVQAARRDLIDSGDHDFSRFVHGFDERMQRFGLGHTVVGDSADALRQRLAREEADAVERKRAGEPWFGPHRFPRPQWPWNIAHLKEASVKEILSKGYA